MYNIINLLKDRSLNDRAIWFNRVLTHGDINEEEYEEIISKYSQTSKEIIDMLVIIYTDSKTALARDYHNSLALEERSFLNLKNIEEYNNSMNNSLKLFENNIDNIYKVDTTNITLNETALLIADNIINIMRVKYINNFINKYYN